MHLPCRTTRDVRSAGSRLTSPRRRLMVAAKLAGPTTDDPAVPVLVAVDRRHLALCDHQGQPVRRWRRDQVLGWRADDIGDSALGHRGQIVDMVTEGAHYRLLVPAPVVGPLLAAVGRAALGPLARRLSPPPPTTTHATPAAERRRRHHPPAWAGCWHLARTTLARRPRWALSALCLAALGLAAGGTPALLQGAATTSTRSAPVTADLARAFGAGIPLHLAPATTAPAPAPASLAVAPPLAAHEVFGFAPYWALVDPASIDLSGLTTVAYFSVDVAADGQPVTSGPGWTGYQSQAFADIVTAAHRGGVRVVLTATCFDQPALDQLTHDPAAQRTLASSLVALVRAKQLDGVNLDFEGTGANDQAGLDQLVATVSAAMAAADPHWQLTIDTYGSSAADPSGFYDVRGLARSVDAFVVMAYDMGSPATPGPTAPLAGAAETDQGVAAAYAATVGPAKVILGLPLYGYDWPTTGPAAGDPATGPAVPVADDQVPAGAAVFWDPSTHTPWAAYQVGGQWHQLWFDDAASLAAKAQLADADRLRGNALWALGMATGTGDQQAVVTASTSQAPPPDGPLAPPSAAGDAPTAAASPTPPLPMTPAALQGPPAPATADALYGGVPVTLTALPAPGDPASGQTTGVPLTDVSAADPADPCPSAAGPLPVTPLAGTGQDLVTVPASPTCPASTWTFPDPTDDQGAASSPGTGSDAGTGAGAGIGSGTPRSSGGATGLGAGTSGASSGSSSGSGGTSPSGGAAGSSSGSATGTTAIGSPAAGATGSSGTTSSLPGAGAGSPSTTTSEEPAGAASGTGDGPGTSGAPTPADRR